MSVKRAIKPPIRVPTGQCDPYPFGQPASDLHQAMIPTSDGPWVRLDDQKNCIEGDHYSVYFRDLEERLVDLINNADGVLGCVAWMTSEPILRAMAKKKMATVIVNKEDFLRPDYNGAGARRDLRPRYLSLPGMCRYAVQSCMYSTSSSPHTEGVRCAGATDRSGKGWNAKMHNKFLIFYSSEERPPSDGFTLEQHRESCGYVYDYTPYAVWTGSFNFTYNAGRSLENAVLLKDISAVKAYEEEFGAILGISEPLDWQSQYVQPEYRFGT